MSSPGCPNANESRELLTECLSALGITEAVVERLGPIPSPSIRTDGIDVMRPDHPPGECCRLFKRVTHDTIFSYIRLYRITQASKLLRETGLSVEDIATECGFASASYFISAFKKCLKTTPLRYRNGA